MKKTKAKYTATCCECEYEALVCIDCKCCDKCGCYCEYLLKHKDTQCSSKEKIINIMVAISGKGRTLKNLIDNLNPSCRISSVIADRKCDGLKIAYDANLQVINVAKQTNSMFDLADSFNLDLICLAGFNSKLTIPDKWINKVMNIHPSLLPAFGGKGMYGLHVHEAVLNAGVKVSGCTVHFCDNEYDRGPIISQSVVPVYDNDNPRTLAERIFVKECKLYPDVIDSFRRDMFEIKGRRVIHLIDTLPKILPTIGI